MKLSLTHPGSSVIFQNLEFGLETRALGRVDFNCELFSTHVQFASENLISLNNLQYPTPTSFPFLGEGHSFRFNVFCK